MKHSNGRRAKNISFVTRHEEPHCLFPNGFPFVGRKGLSDSALFEALVEIDKNHGGASESTVQRANRFSTVRSETAADILAIITQGKSEIRPAVAKTWAWRKLAPNGSFFMAGNDHSTEEGLLILARIVKTDAGLASVDSLSHEQRTSLAAAIANDAAAITSYRTGAATGLFDYHDEFMARDVAKRIKGQGADNEKTAKDSIANALRRSRTSDFTVAAEAGLSYLDGLITAWPSTGLQGSNTWRIDGIGGCIAKKTSGETAVSGDIEEILAKDKASKAGSSDQGDDTHQPPVDLSAFSTFNLAAAKQGARLFVSMGMPVDELINHDFERLFGPRAVITTIAESIMAREDSKTMKNREPTKTASITSSRQKKQNHDPTPP